jgi:acetyl-CoA carboxylase, biotin carboxylase subunit
VFRRVLVANRGEIALRVIHACRKLGVESVAVYSEADADSPHLEAADETVCIGPGRSAGSYLNQDAILQAARQTNAQALHPGYGFLAENARFAARCQAQGTTFIGPRPGSLRMMGDKVTARATMGALGVVGVPGSKGLVRTEQEAVEAAHEVGFPVLLKATAGGGGKGMRVCRSVEELPRAYDQASLEAVTAFGDGSLYLERFVESGRHIEFQVLGDQYGHVIHLGERECSVQRSNQKLLEEAPSTCVSAEQREQLGATLCAALSNLGYVGAGTVEFLRAPTGELFFLEMNTRLQVEHPVSELVTGIDLVAWQLRVAAGQRLTVRQEDVILNGHAIECRLNAEDPANNFRPSPGLLSTFAAPEAWRYRQEGPIRLDSHAREGYRIPTFYDSLIGKLIVRGDSRDDAIEAMLGALAQLVIEGVPTTRGVHRAVLASDAFRSGNYDTAQMGAFMATYKEEG